jgi:hypothetical protein
MRLRRVKFKATHRSVFANAEGGLMVISPSPDEKRVLSHRRGFSQNGLCTTC